MMSTNGMNSEKSKALEAAVGAIEKQFGKGSIMRLESTFEEEHAEIKLRTRIRVPAFKFRFLKWSINGLHTADRRGPRKPLISVQITA